MFDVESNNTIHVTRGDICYFGVSAKDDVTEEAYIFQPGDIVRIKVYGKKNCEKVVLEKDFLVETATDDVYIYLDKEDTTIGGIINKATTYWYEVILNPDIKEQTIIGNSKDGAALFILYPEGAEIPKTDEEIKNEDIPVVDKELNPLSERPIANSAVARAFLSTLEEMNSLRIELESIKSGSTQEGAEV